MAKKTRSLNPADAFRKAQRQKEIKRNKLDRKKAREGAQTKKDSTGLPAAPDLRNDAGQYAQKVNSSKHLNSAPNSRTMNWFGPDGKLLEPERSFYYHPVFNPFGVPPPGMPVRMKDTVDLPSHTPVNDLEHGGRDVNNIHESQSSSPEDGVSDKEEDTNDESSENENESEEESTENDEDEIPLPEGSPPGSQSEDDTDVDIPLPEGPPPPKPVQKLCHEQPLINRPRNFPTKIQQQASHPHPSLTQPQPFFPPPITLIPGGPPPPIIAGMPFPLGPNGLPLPPPPINNFHSLPPPPHFANLPAKPGVTASHQTAPTSTIASNSKPTVQTSVTVTALPQLRDLKREATSFVPAAIRKKRKELDRRAGLAGLGDSQRIQAAPKSFNDSNNQDSFYSESHDLKQVTTSLLAALKRDGVVSDTPVSKTPIGAAGVEKDDYDKFVESLGDVL